MPDASASAFRRLSAIDSACIAILMNHTLADMAGGYPYSFILFLLRVAKKDGVLVKAPYANSPPGDWLVTFADRSSLPRRERIPALKIDAIHGSAFGAFLCKADVTFYSIPTPPNFRWRMRSQRPWNSGPNTAPDRMALSAVQYRPSSKSVSEMITVGWGDFEGGFLKQALTHLAVKDKTNIRKE